MQKISTLIIALTTLCATAFATNTVIVNPVYEFRSIGFKYITKIELSENETRIHVQASFIPYTSWVSFSDVAYIEDYVTEERWQVTGIIGSEFNERVYMPASGDSLFVLIFPPLDNSVTKINFSNFSPIIFGISLNPETQPRSREIPDDVLQWINDELANARRQTMMDFAAGEFFATDTARVVGYIRGFNHRAEFSTGMIINRNTITQEDNSTLIRFHEDGRFEANIPISYPTILAVPFDNIFQRRFSVPFYIQPGQTLAIIVDWDEFLMADRLRRSQFVTLRDVQFKGVTADISSELLAFDAQLPSFPVGRIFETMWSDETTPDGFKSFLYEAMLEYNDTVQRLLEAENLSEAAKNILRYENLILNIGYLMEFNVHYRGELPLEFFSFLQRIPMNNRELLSMRHFSTFINHFEHSQPFVEASRAASRADLANIPRPAITFIQYLFEELSLPKTPEDEIYVALTEILVRDGVIMVSTPEERELFEKWQIANSEFMERYQEHLDVWRKKYLDVLPPPSPLPSMVERELKRWQIRDFIYTHALNLELGIVSDIIRIRTLDRMFGRTFNDNKADALHFLINMVANISEPFLREEAVRIFLNHFPAGGRRTIFELPDTDGAALFQELIAPFRGKMVLVNFWATWCGPCISNMREQRALRERYKDSPDVAFVFITDFSSPLNTYETFVEYQGLVHSFRIPTAQKNLLRELFSIRGIPHYVLVDREGNVVDRDFTTARSLNISAPLLPQLN